MNDYFLSKIVEYMRQGKLEVEFVSQFGGEQSIYYILLYPVSSNEVHKFKIRKSDKAVLKFIAKMEGVSNAIRR